MEKKIQWDDRPRLHFTPKKGWMNDPNGLVFFKGAYHLFYQYNPYHSNWDSMHWGHAVSQDLLHWEELEPALIPDASYDRDKEGGCFSGSAVVWKEKLYLFYTGTVKKQGRSVQTQCLAVSEDGRVFHKAEENPLIARVPEGGGEDFRDPKVFYAQGKWRMVCGGTDGAADCRNSVGRIYLYSSLDLYHWEYNGILYRAEKGEGSMFECPDVFPLGDSWVITASPMNTADFRTNIYIVGRADFDQCSFSVERRGILDGGTHYYAVQNYPDRAGNRLSVAWLGGWLWMPWIPDFGPEGAGGYRGVLSIPRKMFLDEEGYLCAKLPDELENCSEVVRRAGVLEAGSSESITVSRIDRTFRMSLKIDFGKSKERILELVFLEENGGSITARLNPAAGTLAVDHSRADAFSRFGIHEMKCEIDGTETDIEILVDKSVFSMFIHHGRYCYTGKFYPAGAISLNASFRTEYQEV